ncbi:hypothetical protein F4677DRAFT_453234 [Hypoxylon crocopeplum]|nr:hypothetical protein F4677DRAFT_453234 [Hypoxylon crocopeplum]
MLEWWWDRGYLPATSSSGPLSQNYRGVTDDPANHSQHIPIQQSCSVWIIGLPPNCTLSQLLSNVRGAGKIFRCYINPPSGVNETAAAKIVFWDRAGTDSFLNQYVWGCFRVGQYRPTVTMNRIRTGEQPQSDCTRVLRIVGPDSIINERYLTAFFERHFYYELEEATVIHHNVANQTARIEFRFSSYKAQSASAAELMEKAIVGDIDMSDEEMELWCQVRYFWGPDPCASSNPRD